MVATVAVPECVSRVSGKQDPFRQDLNPTDMIRGVLTMMDRESTGLQAESVKIWLTGEISSRLCAAFSSNCLRPRLLRRQPNHQDFGIGRKRGN